MKKKLKVKGQWINVAVPYIHKDGKKLKAFAEVVAFVPNDQREAIKRGFGTAVVEIEAAE